MGIKCKCKLYTNIYDIIEAYSVLFIIHSLSFNDLNLSFFLCEGGENSKETDVN